MTDKNQSATAAATAASTAAPPATSTIAAQVGVAPPRIEKKAYPKVGRVRSRVGRMVHLHTGVVVDNDSEKKMELDGFARSQLDAGKWELVTD